MGEAEARIRTAGTSLGNTKNPSSLKICGVLLCGEVCWNGDSQPMKDEYVSALKESAMWDDRKGHLEVGVG
jgi:hypothetical protein